MTVQGKGKQIIVKINKGMESKEMIGNDQCNVKVNSINVYKCVGKRGTDVQEEERSNRKRKVEENMEE